jgi:hypothetical protein
LRDAEASHGECARLQAALGAADESLRVAEAGRRGAEEHAAREVQRWRAKAHKYRQRKIQAEEMLRRGAAEGGVGSSQAPAEGHDGGRTSAAAAAAEMDKLRAEEALRAERARWALQERELRDALDSLRSQALSADMSRYAREDASSGAPRPSMPPPPNLQLLARKAVMLEHSLPAALASGGSRASSASRRRTPTGRMV